MGKCLKLHDLNGYKIFREKYLLLFKTKDCQFWKNHWDLWSKKFNEGLEIN